MVRADLLDVIDRILRVFRKKQYEPFGGVQVVLIGDVFQLPPIVKQDIKEIFSNIYDSHYFFSSNVFKESNPAYIELKKVYRQKDLLFIDLLNRIRIDEVSDEDVKLLNSKYIYDIDNISDERIILDTHNKKVDKINEKRLEKLSSKLFTYKAKVTGIFKDNDFPTSLELELKVGAQIMFVKNNINKKYYNGKIGKIKKLENDNITVVIDNGNEFIIEKEVWNNIAYSYDKKANKIIEEVNGTFTQYPIKLA